MEDKDTYGAKFFARVDQSVDEPVGCLVADLVVVENYPGR